MMSAPKISGILSRDSFTAAVCIRRAISAPLPLNTPVRRICRTSSSCPSKPGPLVGGLSCVATPPPQALGIRVNCPAFSATVIWRTSASTKLGTGSSPTACNSARAGLWTQAAIAPAPKSAARREILVSSIDFPS